MKAAEVVPSLSMSVVAIRSLLEQSFSNGGDGNVDRIATVTAAMSTDNILSKTSSLLLSLSESNGRVCNSPTYQQRGNCYNEHNLTIPFSIRKPNDVTLHFDNDSTSNLIQNLGKTIRSTREFSLRSCLRIRAAGHVQKIRNTLSGSYRFEAILPNVSFHGVRIKNVPILSTPLSLKLAKHIPTMVPTTSTDSSNVCPQMGYLTMNQTRKLVPLLETDPSITMSPIVGVWVSLPDNDEVSSTILSHPLAWGSCVRFMCSERIQDKAFIASNTFLFVNFCGNYTKYYEITLLPTGALNDHTTANNESALALSCSDNFLCTDFTVDLSATDGDNNGYSEPVICKFRPLTRLDYIRSFRESLPSASGITSTIITAAVDNQFKVSTEYTSGDRALKPSNIPNENSLNREIVVEESNEETVTPVPRGDLPHSINTNSPQKPLATASGRVSYDSTTSASISHNAGVFSNTIAVAAAGVNTGAVTIDGVQCAFPAEIIMAQQIQLDALRNQVNELRALVLSLGGKIPTETATSNSLVDEDVSLNTSNLIERNDEMISKLEQDANDAILADKQLDEEYNSQNSDYLNSLVDEVNVLDTSVSVASSISNLSFHQGIETSKLSTIHHKKTFNPLDNTLIPNIPSIKNAQKILDELRTSSESLNRNIDLLEEFSMIETESILAIQSKYLNK